MGTLRRLGFFDLGVWEFCGLGMFGLLGFGDFCMMESGDLGSLGFCNCFGIFVCLVMIPYIL